MLKNTSKLASSLLGASTLAEPFELTDAEIAAVAGGGNFIFGVGGNAGNADHSFFSSSALVTNGENLNNNNIFGNTGTQNIGVG